MRHAKGLEDLFLSELRERFAAHSFHNDGQKEIAGVAVQELLAWLEAERLLPGQQVKDFLFAMDVV
jgi:hypothetical protein